MGRPRISYRCTLVIACISFAAIAGIATLHRPPHFYLSLHVPNDAQSYVIPSVPSDTIETQSYVIAIRYQEQLTSGIRNALQLSHLFKGHGSRLVVPFIAGTRLFGLHQKAYPLTRVLDFSAIARECFHISNVASFDEFLHTSTRDIVLLHPVSNPDSNSVLGAGPVYSVQRKQSAKDILPCLLDEGVCQCSKEFEEYARSIEHALNMHLNHTDPLFRVRQVICFNKLKPMTVKQFLKLSGLQQATVYSYIFTWWYGTSCISMSQTNTPGNASSTAKARCPGTFRARFIPETASPGVCRKGKVDHSFVSTKFLAPYLKGLAANFASSQRNGTGTKVSIHFRTEWLVIRPRKVECCQTAIVDTLKMIVKMYHTGNVLYVTDLGPFGSKSCENECRRRGKQLIQSIEDSTGLKPVHFDPVNYSAKFEGSDIPPLVENAALSDAEVLVLIGGGKFQSSILTSALLNSSLRHVYSVCSPSTLLDLPDGVVLHSDDTCS